ncbi:MAG: hypothetical protein VB127_13250 [Sphaerochaeta sp.]|jgi:hypothetical protein|nr:hypothetical protein [Sphaerochaeta sp.]
MNWLFKRVGLLLLALCLSANLVADDSVFIGDGDISSLKLYDSQGNALDLTEEVISQIGEGWIISNPDTPLLLVTPRGTINVYENSLLVTGNLVGMHAELYLVSGKATFNTYPLEGSTLTVTTPVSKYVLEGEGEMLVITTDDEESVTAFTGEVESYNGLTRVKRPVRTFEKLEMSERTARAQRIEAGYYLTYATYPDMMLARQLVQQAAEPLLPPAPRSVRAATKPYVVETPLPVSVSITPITSPVSSLSVVEQKPYIPTVMQTISVKVEKIPVPKRVSTLTSKILKAPSDRIVVTIKPLTPEVPQTVRTQVSVVVPPQPTIAEPELGLVAEEPQASQSEQILPEVISEELPVAEVAQPVQEERAVSSDPPAQRPSSTALLAFDDRAQEIKGSIGMEASYRFLLDGPSSNAMNHRLMIKPYYEKGPFALKLQFSADTDAFSTYSNSVTSFPTGTLETISYVFSFFDQARIGYQTSAFYFVMDHVRSLYSEQSTFSAPVFGESEKLVMQNQIKLGGLSLTTTIDDLYLTELLAGRHQFGSSLLEFTAPGEYPLGIAIGALAKVDRSPATIELYPLVSFSFPIINNRTTNLNALVIANSYLPAYPTLDFDALVDTSVATLFPNHLLGAGFYLKHQDLQARMVASITEGKNQSLLVNDFSYALDISYAAALDVLLDIQYTGKVIQARALYNLPVTSSFGIANLTASAHQADYSQFTFAFTKDRLQMGLGLSYLGLFDTLSSVLGGNASSLNLLGGPYSTSYLFASMEFKPFTLLAKASYPITTGSVGVPRLSIQAKINLQKTI